MNPTKAACTLILAGCGVGTGAQPHDMSTAAHEDIARTEENAAELHERYAQGGARGPIPNPEVTLLSGTTCPPSEFAACWGGSSTDVHLAEAEVHRKAATAHRAASQTLGEAERAACVGLANEDRDMSPFEHREDVASVEMRADGAMIFFRPVPRLTQQLLHHLIDCHLARNAALGHDVPEMPTCPLVPKGVSATVSSTPTGLAVTLRSDQAATVRDVQRRAQMLVK